MAVPMPGTTALALAAALLSALLLACADGSPATAPAPTATLVPPPTATPDAPPPTATPAAKLCGDSSVPKVLLPTDRDSGYVFNDLKIFDLAPGYGGLFLLETPSPELDSILHVFMLDISRGQAAKEAVEQVYGDEITKERQFKVLRGRYDVAQLYRWKTCIEDAFKHDNLSITHIYVDSTINSILIMSDEPDDVRKYLREKLSEIGVPPEAVTVRVLVICTLINIECQCPPLRSLSLHDYCARLQSRRQ